MRRLSVRLQALHGEFHGLVIQLISGVGKLRVAGAEQRAFQKWVARYAEKLRLVASIQRVSDAAAVFDALVGPVSTAAIFWFTAKPMFAPGADQVHGLSMGRFLAFFTAYGMFLRGVVTVSRTLVSVADTAAKEKRVQALLDAEPEVPPGAADPGRLRGAIALTNVMFRYRPDGPMTLDGVNVSAEPGEFIALVGPSGSGKSTILRLVLGFDTPEAGSIRFDGQELSGLDVLAVRRQLGVVLQNGRLNAGSIFENIAPGGAISLDQAWEAAADAGLSDDIERLPMKLQTVVSEGGSNLSGGQRQRLLIARALALRAPIVLFDEATSALDNRTQQIVSEALRRRKVTRIVVAHRLSTIHDADRIYVLDKGKVVEQGSYDELVLRGGKFSRLVARQTT